MKLTFLGTSTSVGIPVIGCCCDVCVSKDPRNKRMRSSIHLETSSHSLLVDSGPDLRQQALRHSLTKVDAVLYTHHHLDHIAGFDELRAFCWHREDPLPLYSTPSCLNELKRIFNWAFSDENTYKGYIRPLAMPVTESFQLGMTKITLIPVEHGSIETVGYRFDDGGLSIAYIPDAKSLMAGSADLLENLDHLIIDCLREKPHPTHLSLAESLAIIADVKPKNAWFTHIAHEMDVAKVELTLPPNVKFAHDTLTIPN
jgi:phosphoribosyl 1,2-cyclic phosphate phosphodiesterase